MASCQLLIFKLGSHDFAVDIEHVDTIIPYQETTKVPNTPEYLEGLIDVRGKIYTVFNLRKRLKMSEDGESSPTRIIVLNYKSASVSFLADSANEILRTDRENVEPVPETLETLDRSFLSGVMKSQERLILLLDLEALTSCAKEGSPEAAEA